MPDSLTNVGRSKIFISYRTEDTDWASARLFVDLTRRYGSETVFLDFERISGGDNFPSRLEMEARDALVMLVLIGPNWLLARDGKSGPRRVDQPKDWVRKEIETAFATQHLVLPVYVGAAEKLTYTDLEALPSLKPLIDLQSARLRVQEWEFDLKRIIEAINRPLSFLQISDPVIVSLQDARPPISEKTVDPTGEEGYASISQAIEAAAPGTRILIRPGVYKEHLVLAKPLELIGQFDGAVIEGNKAVTLIFDTNMGTVRNLKFRQSSEKDPCIWIRQGRLDLEDCDITSSGRACITVSGNADPRIRENRIHDGNEVGIFLYDVSRGTIEANQIYGNRFAGVEIAGGAKPMLRGNIIRHGKNGGIYIRGGESGGTIEGNEITGHAVAGLAVRGGANPLVVRNKIQFGKREGIYLFDGGRGTYEDNEILGNQLNGVEINGAGPTTIWRGNRVSRSKRAGMVLRSGGAGVFERNTVSLNEHAGIVLGSDADPLLKNNIITENKREGIYILEDGRGSFEGNQIKQNSFAGVEVAGANADPVFRGNEITGNGRHAVSVKAGAGGIFQGNDLRQNAAGAFNIHVESTHRVRKENNQVE